MSSSIDHTWGHLPYEILSTIFQEVGSSTYRLQTCQLVCKGWSKAAQERLYRHVNLDSTNIDQFIRTIQDSSISVGHSVKSISFLTDNALDARLDEILDTIVRYCPRVEKLHAERFQEQESDSEGLYEEQDQQPVLDMMFYAVFALYYKTTLVDLTLDCKLIEEFEHNDQDWFVTEKSTVDPRPNITRMEKDFNTLRTQLEQFTSLKTVHITSCVVPNLDAFDQLIDGCSPTVHTIYFDYLGLSRCNQATTSNIHPNTHIKDIQLKRSSIPSIALSYLSRKFKALQVFEAQHINNSLMSTIDERNEWWSQLSRLCLPLAQFKMGNTTYKSHTLDELHACLDMSIEASRGMDERIVEVNLARSHPAEAEVRVIKKRNTFKLELDYHENAVQSISTYVFDYLQELGPTQINCYPRKELWLLFYVPALFSSDFTYQNNDKQWPFFKKLVSFASQTQVPLIRLGQLILPDSDPAPIVQPDQAIRLRDIVLTQSYIDHKAFPGMSRYLPNVDRFSLTLTCLIQRGPEMEYRAEVFLPDTQLKAMVLNVIPFDLHFRYEINDCRHSNHWSGDFNEDFKKLLHKAFTHKYMIKIETSTTVFVCSLENGIATRVYDQDAINNGNESSFLIWIKLKAWKEVLVGNGNNFIKLCNDL